MKRKICIVTGSRAEFGLLSCLMKLISEDTELELQIIATNMHLSAEFGLTYKEIEAAGFVISKKVEMLLSSDTATGIAKSVGLANIGFADAYEDLKPHLIVVLGDRYEILAAVSTALFFKIPVAHISGGDVTEGAYDDSIRHAITKMSHFHFTSTEEYKRRVIQMGEQPDKVFNVGAISIDNINHLQLLSKEELEKSIGFTLTNPVFLITYHPVTTENDTSKEQFCNLLEALKLFPEAKLIFTKPNSDTGGRIILKMIDEFVSVNKDISIAYTSLGQLRYLSLLQYIDVVIGNSSSGIVEVPSFYKPTVNIGKRQKGRLRAKSVIDCNVCSKSIFLAIQKSLKPSFIESIKNVINPYERKDTAIKIKNSLKNIDLTIQKQFYDIHK